jgi:predicted enzyme related to lactoylglutathione lyase
MPNINGVLARVFVDDLDAALPLYQELAGVTEVNRFSFRDVQLAQAGPFLLLAGNTQAYRDRVATVLVSRLEPVITAIENAGGSVLEGPSPAPNGARLIARHPGGLIFEYIQTGIKDDRGSRPAP